MPKYPERLDDIKTFLKQSYLSSKPDFRSKSIVFAAWKQLGYTDDPAKLNIQKIDNLTFDDIVKVYEQKVKGKPLTIVIMGDAKLINLKQIEAKYGKITRLSASKLFSVGLE
ncbi:MAG: hypothetical protein LBV75_07325 [Paludibacter sp.]|jgi:predicted Zn-dependent peptidase|nr:hypothetical protein [Paludibacter sp.]